MTEQELKAELKAGKFKRFYLIYGEDGYLKNHYAQLISERAADVLFDMNFKKLDGGRVDFGTIYNETEQLPCMAEHRCVLLTDYDYAAVGEKVQKDFVSMVEQLPDSTVLILLCDTLEILPKKLGKWQSLIKAAEKCGAVLNFEHMTAARLQTMMIKAAEKRKVMLDLTAAKYLIECCGRELAKLQAELNKLCSFAGEGGRITSETIDRLCAKTADANKYQLTKHIFAGDVPSALKMIGELCDMQMKPIEISSLMIGGFVDAYRAKAMSAAGIASKQAATELGYGSRGFALDNSARTASRISLGVMRNCLDILNETDLKLKSSSEDKRFLLEQTVLRLALELKAK